MKNKLGLMLILSAVIVSGCGPAKSQEASVDVSCDDFTKLQSISREVEVAVDSSFTVTLCSNPTTGFQWESAKISDQTVLGQASHKFVSPEENETPPPPGTAGKEVWTFKALKAGKSTISIEYSQPWEGGEKAAWTYALAVVVNQPVVSPTPTPVDLDGTEWVLTALNGNSLIEGTEITLYFEEAFLGGSMSCNGYGGGRDSGKYVATDDGTLTIPQIAVTLQLCSKPEGIMEQEAAYIEALRSAAAYRVMDDRLEIDNAAGETTLVFAREEFLPVPPTPTPMPHNPGVADLLRDPPAPGETIEVDAYFSGAGPVLSPEGPIPRPDEVACPTWWIMDAALTDRQFPAILVLPNAITNNTLPDDAPWLVATGEEATKPGVRCAPQLPYHARLRGHLGHPAFAHCPHADRIFFVEEVVKVYEKEPSAPAVYQLELPEGYADWPRHHDADLGYSLPYPPDWRVESLAEPDVLSAIALRAPQWPDNPVVVRVHDGETHRDPADPASRPPLLEGMGYSPIQQGMTSLGEKVRDSQRLAGYQVDRKADPGEREAAVLFSAHDRTYELALRYPIGLDASQPLLATYAAIVEGFRLDTP